MRLGLKDIEARVAKLGGLDSYDREFIFDLLLAYGRSTSSIKRLRSRGTSSLNIATDPDSEVAQKNIVYFKELPASSDETLLETIEQLSNSAEVVRFKTRFVIVTDYQQLLAKDTLTGESLIISIQKIADHFTFFLPWAGMEKAQYVAEAHADTKAAERMSKLFDELVAVNPEILEDEKGRQNLNVFFARLLFCFFAEDTGIFRENQFTTAVSNYTQLDGSDVDEFLSDLFTALDTPDTSNKQQATSNKQPYLADFPYVNGHLFEIKDHQWVPRFNKRARDYLLENGKLIWSEINPDIFGSMFQAIITPGQRSGLGQHYTSVPNILKTIDPLFLDELKNELNQSFDNERKLDALLKRISQIKIFDPACGSGNFLVIAYKELRKLEHAILERILELRGQHGLQGLYGSCINIENFFGIEIDTFAVEIAILSLWIAKHQMNIEFDEKFGVSEPLIPLNEMGQVHQGNAARMDWNTVCKNDGRTEIYLISNPPYLGAKLQNAEQKEDLLQAFYPLPFNKNLDYVSVWFIKGANYIAGTKAQLSFVSTNSVSQGEHVGLLFPAIFGMGLEIGYAYTSFRWENNAKGNAGVTVVVINLRNPNRKQKLLLSEDLTRTVENINGYLADSPNVFIGKPSYPLSSNLPPMVFGSMPIDSGNLILSESERENLLQDYPYLSRHIKSFIGAKEYIHGLRRYALWVEDSEYMKLKSIEPLQERFKNIKRFRRSSKRPATQELALTPWSFGHKAYKPTESIIVPRVSSEYRAYIPIGYLDKDTVISDAAFAIYDAKPWIFALLTSKIHMVWVRAVGGQLETRLRYSNTLVYNNFPVPALSEDQKEQLTQKAFRVLDVREYHSQHTLADLYDHDRMPDNLRSAHADLDNYVDSIYRKLPFSSDEERLSLLFKMYEDMTDNKDSK